MSAGARTRSLVVAADGTRLIVETTVLGDDVRVVVRRASTGQELLCGEFLTDGCSRSRS